MIYKLEERVLFDAALPVDVLGSMDSPQVDSMDSPQVCAVSDEPSAEDVVDAGEPCENVSEANDTGQSEEASGIDSEESACDEILNESAVNLVPIFEATQVFITRFALYEPRIIIAGGALEIRVFGFDIIDKSGQTPPFSFRDGIQQVE